MGDPGLEFSNDLITLFKKKWIDKTGGKRPDFSTKWNIKEVGRGNRQYTNIIIDSDVDDPTIFSLQFRKDNVPSWDFYHYISSTVDIITSESETRMKKVAFEIVRILKTNVVPQPEDMNNHVYTQMLPGPFIDLNEDFRGIFRKTMTVDSERFNPP